MSKINSDLDKRLKDTEACYKFEKLNYDSGLLDTNVDVTYIIHLENSGRYDNIIKQLEKYKPTKTIYILLNKGFSKCNKTGIESSYADLTDCYLQIFKHAQKQNFGNILILEDDFIFNEKVNGAFKFSKIVTFILWIFIVFGLLIVSLACLKSNFFLWSGKPFFIGKL